MGDKAAAKKAMSEANTAFKAKKYEESIEKYTKAVELDPKDATYPANRANVYLKMQKWTEAEQDCDAALKIKKDHAKVAYFLDPFYSLFSSTDKFISLFSYCRPLIGEVRQEYS